MRAIRHDGNTGSTTATLIGRMASEGAESDRTMIGYFVGGEFAHSDIHSTTLNGETQHYGATIGRYAVYQLQ